MISANTESESPTRARRELLGIDPRSLALLRIGLGGVLLLDVLLRIGDLRDHYTDWGVLPRSAVQDWLPLRTSAFPLYFVDGSAPWAALLFAVTAAAALALLLGWRTRWATLACWLLVSSLQIRNPAVLHNGDNLLRILLVWSLFLPLGAAWSLDQRRTGRTARRELSVAALGLRLQLCFVYWFTAALKTDPMWTHDHTAVLAALHLDHMTTSWGLLLRELPALLEIATVATLVLEILGPLLLWIPWRIGPLRTAIVSAFVAFHLLALAPALDLGTFPWVAAVAWSIFLPTWFWDRVRSASLPYDVDATSTSTSTARWSGRRDLLPALLLLLVVVWNVRTLVPQRLDPVLKAIDPVVQIVGLQQTWNMFAPRPPAEDGWYVVPARLRNGQMVDALRLAPVDFAKPEDVNETFLNARWIKYFMNLATPEYLPHRPLLGRYLCRRFNDGRLDAERAEQLEMIFVLEIFEPGRGVLAPQPIPLGGQRCPTR